MKRKIILTAFAATSLLFYSTQAFALINFSVGIPFSHTITGKYSDGTEIKSDGVSGMFIQVGVPILPGIGIDSYKTKLKDTTVELATMIYNLYYLLPIPIINLTLGAGIGTTEYQCTICGETFDKGSASQWYASIGMPIIPLFDLHLSYRSVSAKNIKWKDGRGKEDNSGSVMGLGIGFNF